MRVDGRIPIGSIVGQLWRLRELSAETFGVHGAASVRTILDAFSGEEPGKTFAACLIVSDGLDECRREARDYLLQQIEADVAVDPLTGLLCLEALQIFSKETWARPKVRKFIKHCTELRNASDLAFSLLEKLGGEGAA